MFSKGDYGFFYCICKTPFLTLISSFFGFLVYYIGTILAISSSSRLSADGSLSDPELPPSSPIVIMINFLLFVSSFSISNAFSSLYCGFSSSIGYLRSLFIFLMFLISLIFTVTSILQYTIKDSNNLLPAIIK